jgi:excisionase family DNA binding protein
VKDYNQPPLAVTVEQAATMLSLSRAKVYLLMDEGRLDYIKIDTARRVPVDAIYEFVEQHRKRATAS